MFLVLYFAILIAATTLGWSTGSNDVANSTSVIGSGVLRFRTAFILFSVSQLIGGFALELYGYENFR
ncbi:MAG: hypothetical protein QW128_08160 [Thermoprotei archaeon]